VHLSRATETSPEASATAASSEAAAAPSATFMAITLEIFHSTIPPFFYITQKEKFLLKETLLMCYSAHETRLVYKCLLFLQQKPEAVKIRGFLAFESQKFVYL
jgi:hypothetical protein